MLLIVKQTVQLNSVCLIIDNKLCSIYYLWFDELLDDTECESFPFAIKDSDVVAIINFNKFYSSYMPGRFKSN